MPIASTSRESLSKISLPERQTTTAKIEAVVITAMRNGAPDLSMREIQAAFEAQHGRRIDLCFISARINELVAAKRLDRNKMITRPCSLSNSPIHPITAPAQQQRMFY